MTTQSTAAHGRFHALDGLRATMMLLGILLHGVISYAVMSFGAAWPYDDPTTTSVADLLVFFIHVFRMPIFFVLAGFFAALLYARRGAAGLVRNRFKRIALPLVWSLMLLHPLISGGFNFANIAKAQGAAVACAKVGEMSLAWSFYVPAHTMHLWFLYYLLFFYAGALLLVRASAWIPPHARTRFRRGFRALVSHPVARIVVPAAITFCTLLPMGGILQTRTSFIPDAAVLIAYGVFFGFGWLLYAAHDVVAGFVKGAWSLVLAAIIAFFAMTLFVLPGSEEGSTRRIVLGAALNSTVVWMLFYGFTGLFLKYFDKPSPSIRYVVDASYWVYLVHLACVIWIAGLLVNTDVSVWMRLLIVLAGTTFIGFGSYALFVRSTAIGRALNGQAYPRGASAQAA